MSTCLDNSLFLSVNSKSYISSFPVHHMRKTMCVSVLYEEKDEKNLAQEREVVRMRINSFEVNSYSWSL
ncbi:unnamed protein product [Brassica oleracea var. botrytis]